MPLQHDDIIGRYENKNMRKKIDQYCESNVIEMRLVNVKGKTKDTYYIEVKGRMYKQKTKSES